MSAWSRTASDSGWRLIRERRGRHFIAFCLALVPAGASAPAAAQAPRVDASGYDCLREIAGHAERDDALQDLDQPILLLSARDRLLFGGATEGREHETRDEQVEEEHADRHERERRCELEEEQRADAERRDAERARDRLVREQHADVRERLEALEHLTGRNAVEERDRQLQDVRHQLIEQLAIEVRAEVSVTVELR